MRVLLFLNELSCTSETDTATVDEGMRQFVDTLRHVRNKRDSTALVASAPLRQLELAPGYHIAEWAGKPQNKDRWRFIQQFRNRSPVSSALPDGALNDLEYTHNGRTAYGLAGAHMRDGIAISLPLDTDWNTPWVTARRTKLVETDESTLDYEQDDVDIRHTSAATNIAEHDEWITHSGLTGIASGTELWDARADFFPQLQFLPRVEGDLHQLERSFLRPVRDRLMELQAAAASWDPNYAEQPTWQSHVTPEGSTRKRLCRFEDLDGTTRTFHLHARFTPGAGRVHFRLLPEERIIRIAYIGRKIGIT